MAHYISSSSDDSEALERLYSSLRPKTQSKYRLSTGSLDNFIADSDDESIISDEPSEHNASQIEKKLDFSQSSSDEKENTTGKSDFAPRTNRKKNGSSSKQKQKKSYTRKASTVANHHSDVPACNSKVPPHKKIQKERKSSDKSAQVGLNITNTLTSQRKDITKLLDAYLSSEDDEENKSSSGASSCPKTVKSPESSSDNLEDSLIRQLRKVKVTNSSSSNVRQTSDCIEESEDDKENKSVTNAAKSSECTSDDDLEDSLIRQIRDRKVAKPPSSAVVQTPHCIDKSKYNKENKPVFDIPGTSNCPKAANNNRSESSSEDDLEDSLIRQIRDRKTAKPSSTVGQTDLSRNCTSGVENKELNKKLETNATSDGDKSPLQFKTPVPRSRFSHTMEEKSASMLQTTVLFSSSDEDELDISLLHRIQKKQARSSTTTLQDNKVESNKKDSVKDVSGLQNKESISLLSSGNSFKTPKPFREPKTPAGGSEHSRTVTFSSSDDEDDGWGSNLLYRIAKNSDIDLSDCSYVRDGLKAINKKKSLTNQPESPINISSSSDEALTTPAKGKVMADGEKTILENFKTPMHVPRSRSTKRLGGSCKVEGCFLSTLKDDNPKQFKKDRDRLTKDLFKLFNTSVFNDLLPAEMLIDWSKRMTKTAGVTSCRRVVRDTENRLMRVAHYQAKITLSEKVITTPQRLRDTLIHEMCHAAVWVLDHANESHGPRWKFWGRRSCTVHPELPMMERCHMYTIKYKYVYECTRCDTTVGRHSKSLDTSKWACARCKGRLRLREDKKSQPLTPFAKFVKENYKETKARIGGSASSGKTAHVNVMKNLSEQFKSAANVSNKS